MTPRAGDLGESAPAFSGTIGLSLGCSGQQ
jgi:hypothetical protein